VKGTGTSMMGRSFERLLFAVICCVVVWAPHQASYAATHTQSDTFARTIYLVRHGAYDSSAATESPDGPGLTPLGITQARLLGARLRGLPSSVTMLTASTMARARETAAVLHESLPSVPLQESNLLRECTPPMRGEQEPDPQLEKEERACQITLDEAFRQYLVPARALEQRDVLVCHGNVIRYFVMKALGVDTRAWTELSVAHASLTVIRVRADGKMSVLAVGDVGHIPPNLQSWGTAAGAQLVTPSWLPTQPKHALQ
jgi:serine/threonine-protein phosphatase PGAM5